MTVQGVYPIPAEYGDRVRYVRSVRRDRSWEAGLGTFVLAWLGIEEAWNVETEDGRTVTLYPCFGDTMVPV